MNNGVCLLSHKVSLKFCQSRCLNFLRVCNHAVNKLRRYTDSRPAIILGIETSCDETGCGIVDTTGKVMGDTTNSQHATHLKHGGIIPIIAGDIHKQNITTICENTLRLANLRLRDIDAIATTIKPGLPNSLTIGNTFGKYLSRVGNKPYIPIHHMEAHALTVRMVQKVDFPYLVLLISGAHSLLAIVDSVDKFYTLGTTKDNAPGEVLDKIARRLKLVNIPEFSHMSGGQAIESAANRATDPNKFKFPLYLTHNRDCQFSFAGTWTSTLKHIVNQEKEFQIDTNKIIPDAFNLCSSLQWSIAKQICNRTQRAMKFIDKMDLIPQKKRTLVISGGVACNNFFAKALEIVCSEEGFQFVRTPPRLCNDNGVMIAWNGVERWVMNTGVIRDKNEIEAVTIEKKVPLGENWTEKLRLANIKCKILKLNALLPS